jgi:hypothetical protein
MDKYTFLAGRSSRPRGSLPSLIASLPCFFSPSLGLLACVPAFFLPLLCCPLLSLLSSSLLSSLAYSMLASVSHRTLVLFLRRALITNLDLMGFPFLFPHITFVLTPVVGRKTSRSIVVGSTSIGGPRLSQTFRRTLPLTFPRALVMNLNLTGFPLWSPMSLLSLLRWSGGRPVRVSSSEVRALAVPVSPTGPIVASAPRGTT